MEKRVENQRGFAYLLQTSPTTWASFFEAKRPAGNLAFPV
jgi:hypothetical protein